MPSANECLILLIGSFSLVLDSAGEHANDLPFSIRLLGSLNGVQHRVPDLITSAM